MSAPLNQTLPQGLELKKIVFAQHTTTELDQLLELDEDEQITRLLQVAKEAGNLRSDVTDLSSARHLLTVYKAHRAALSDYAPQAYQGTAVVFLPEDGSDQVASDWRRLIKGGVAIERVPGNHYTFLTDPNVAALATRFAKHLPIGMSSFH